MSNARGPDQLRSQTVWCASYPKSGNTWVRSLVQALRSGESPDINRLGADGHADDDLMRGLGLSASGLSETMTHGFLRLGWALAGGSDPAQRVLRKTHAPWLPVDDGYPQCWQPEGAKAIYIVRDPRAVAVSWAHHIGHPTADAVDIMSTDRIDSVMLSDIYGGFHPGNWSSHVNSWLDQTDLPTFVIRYEDLSLNPLPTVTRLAQWLDLPTDTDRLQNAIESCAFEQLAAAEIIDGFAEAAAPGRVFFRRGETDAWRTELEPLLRERIEHDHSETMARLGYFR